MVETSRLILRCFVGFQLQRGLQTTVGADGSMKEYLGLECSRNWQERVNAFQTKGGPETTVGSDDSTPNS
jgi:hypothetical protein